jgi:hypothetical protein
MRVFERSSAPVEAQGDACFRTNLVCTCVCCGAAPRSSTSRLNDPLLPFRRLSLRRSASGPRPASPRLRAAETCTRAPAQVCAGSGPALRRALYKHQTSAGLHTPTLPACARRRHVTPEAPYAQRSAAQRSAAVQLQPSISRRRGPTTSVIAPLALRLAPYTYAGWLALHAQSAPRRACRLEVPVRRALGARLSAASWLRVRPRPVWFPNPPPLLDVLHAITISRSSPALRGARLLPPGARIAPSSGLGSPMEQ